MPAVRDEGICLRHWDWSETSQTVSLFGRTLGVVRGLAKGSRREGGRFGGGIDLLTRGEFGAIIKSTTELCTLTEWDLIEAFPGLRESLPRNRAAFYAADLVQRLLAPADPHPGLFDTMVALLRALGGATVPARSDQTTQTSQALLHFQWRLLAETGVQPSLEAPGGGVTLWFDPREGRFTDDQPPLGWRVRRPTFELLERVDAAPMGDVSAPIEVLDRANRLLAAYLREVMQTEPSTLTDLFGTIAPGSIRDPRRSI